uniref:Impact RWD domain protein n=1 Tax=Callorhinchus milii TaxID=7868 RepID=A0A4W3HCH0_CALMI
MRSKRCRLSLRMNGVLLTKPREYFVLGLRIKLKTRNGLFAYSAAWLRGQERTELSNSLEEIYLIYCEDKQTFLQDCEDDGETAAGGRLLHLMQILDVRNVMVVVSRWYGGILLGPDRFKHINNSARNILVNEGYSETVVSLSTEFNNAVTAKELAEDYSTLTVPRSSASKTKHVKHSKARSNIWDGTSKTAMKSKKQKGKKEK